MEIHILNIVVFLTGGDADIRYIEVVVKKKKDVVKYYQNHTNSAFIENLYFT